MTSQITGVDPALNRLVQGGGFCSSSGFPNRACTTALIKTPWLFFIGSSILYQLPNKLGSIKSIP